MGHPVELLQADGIRLVRNLPEPKFVTKLIISGFFGSSIKLSRVVSMARFENAMQCRPALLKAYRLHDTINSECFCARVVARRTARITRTGPWWKQCVRQTVDHRTHRRARKFAPATGISLPEHLQFNRECSANSAIA